jgi:hypothetical protein
MNMKWIAIALLAAAIAIPVSRSEAQSSSPPPVAPQDSFLSHPAALASIAGMRVFSSTSFSSEIIPVWKNTTSLPSMNYDYPFEADGHGFELDSLIGFSAPLGGGRAAFFFEYGSQRSRCAGSEKDFGSGTADHKFEFGELSSDLSFRTLYAARIGGASLGAEAGLSYTDESIEGVFADTLLVGKNIIFVSNLSPALDLFTYAIPYKTDCLELFGKLSYAGSIGRLDNLLTVSGGLALSGIGANSYDYQNGSDWLRMEGDVSGWNGGIDCRIRMPLSASAALPFVLAGSYKTIERDGAGESTYNSAAEYSHEREVLQLIFGGGVEAELAKSAKLSASLYYDFYFLRESLFITDRTATIDYDYQYPDYPRESEHRLTLSGAFEKSASKSAALRTSASVFFGFVRNEYASGTREDSVQTVTGNLVAEGYDAGADVALSVISKRGDTKVEPSLNAGFRMLSISGDGTYILEAEGSTSRYSYSIGVGLSVIL